MDNLRTEVTAVLKTGLAFTEFGWIFREQPRDFGIDAMVETKSGKHARGKFMALQIKGGLKKLHRTKDSLTFYFSTRHHMYWANVSQSMPLMIVVHDEETDQLHWQVFDHTIAVRTRQGYKLDIPVNNVLDRRSKPRIANWIASFSENIIRTTRISEEIIPWNELHIEYLPSDKNVPKLIMSVCDGIQDQTIEIPYDLPFDPTTVWRSTDASSEALRSIEYFLRWRHTQIRKGASGSFKETIEEVQNWLSEYGLKESQARIFDAKNSGNDVPCAADFVAAFQKYTGLRKEQFVVDFWENTVHFETSQFSYELTTWQSHALNLRSWTQSDAIEELYCETLPHIWNEIFVDPGIDKVTLFPVLLWMWHDHWNDLPRSQAFQGDKRLNARKEDSWRTLDMFRKLYDDAVAPVMLSYELDEDLLYPLVVLSMLDIYDTDTCYSEYCEFELFGEDDWEMIELNEDSDDDDLLFFVRHV